MVRRSHAKPAASPKRSRRASHSAEAGDGGSDQEKTKDIWKGTIAFGLVEIPVALVAAELPHGVKLTYLDRRDFSPVGYRRYNKSNEEEVPWSEIVRGYEYEKGEYVVLTPQDLERASPELTKTIDILHFVDAGEIEPIYYDRPYYLEPLRPRSKGYVLLRETLKRMGKVGIAKVAIRAREHIAAVGVRGQALVLNLLRFSNELRAPSALDNAPGSLEDARVRPGEIEIAERLVEDMSSKWDPKEFSDDYAADLMKLVKSRVAAGRTHVIDESEPKRGAKRQADVLDLMPLLKKSLSARGTNGRRAVTARKASDLPRARARKVNARTRRRA